MKDRVKINVLLDSNIRNKFYKEIHYHNTLIQEIQRFGKIKKLQPMSYISNFSVYEEAGFGKLVNLDIPTFEDDIRKLESTTIGSEEEAKVLFDLAESFLIHALSKIGSIDKYGKKGVLESLGKKIAYIDNEVLKKRFMKDFIDGYNDKDLDVLHGCIAFEFLQDKFLKSKVDPDRRALFLLSLFYHFLSDMRSNSLFRSAHQIWTESFVNKFLKDNPSYEVFFNEIGAKFKINSREDFVDNEIVHFAVMGNRKKGAKIKFLVLTNDPMENVLYRISLYKFTVQNSIEIGKGLSRPVVIPEMNCGYIGFFQDNKIKWINVATIPPIGALKSPDEIPIIASRL